MKTGSVTHNEKQEPKRLALSIDDAAWKLSVSASFIRLEIARGRLRPSRLGRRVVITEQEIERYLNLSRSRLDGSGPVQKR